MKKTEFLIVLSAIAALALASCGDDSSSSSGDDSSEALSSDGGTSQTASSSSEEPFDPGEGNHAVTVSVFPADSNVVVGPAAANAVADGKSFKAWVKLPAQGGETTVYRQKGWNDAAHTVGDTVSLAKVSKDVELVDTISVLRIVKPANGDVFAKGDSVEFEFEGANLPNGVDVVLCPTRECAQSEKVLEDLPAEGGKFKFAMPSKWAAGDGYYLKAIVDANFWARAKNILVTDVAAGDWTPVPLQSSITKALPMTGIMLWSNDPKPAYEEELALEFNYCYPAEVVKGKNSDGTIDYDWSGFDARLDSIAARGHQMVALLAYENPKNTAFGDSGATAVPAYIKARSDYHETFYRPSDGPTWYADWSNAELKWFTKQFITDFAAKYENDPRLAFLEVGFGHWSEYHISSTPLDSGVNFPTRDYQKEWALHLGATLHDLPWIVGIAVGTKDYGSPFRDDAEVRALDFGLLDCTFMAMHHEEGDCAQCGYNEGLWKKMDYGNHWQTAPNGGEISYWTYGSDWAYVTAYDQAHNDWLNVKAYDQKNFLREEGIHGHTWAEMAAKYHLTFMLGGNDMLQGGHGSQENVLRGSLATGYRFRVTSFARTSTQARVTVKNEGVAPIYRDAYIAVNGTRGGESLKGLLPGDSVTAMIPATGDLTLAIECDHTLPGRPIQYLADLD
ncbi:MAG: hypothetical protein J6T45_01060 [Fibrobacterales bacterium]|nr:hypothetical protein [Fibrobacterales bacterium]